MAAVVIPCGGTDGELRMLDAGPSQKPVTSLSFPAAVTAVAFAGRDTADVPKSQAQAQSSFCLAVGLESGDVQIWSLTQPSVQQEEGFSSSSRQPETSPDDAASQVSRPTSASGAEPVEPASPSDWCHRLLWKAPEHARHTGAVRRLRWRTVVSGCWQLASCSDDHAIRTYDIRTY